MQPEDAEGDSEAGVGAGLTHFFFFIKDHFISFFLFLFFNFGFIYLFIYLFIYGCVGSLFLCEGFL